MDKTKNKLNVCVRIVEKESGEKIGQVDQCRIYVIGVYLKGHIGG